MKKLVSHSLVRSCAVATHVLMVLAMTSLVLHAQETSTDAAGLPDVQQLEALITTLENEGERTAFIENLKALSDAQREVEGGEPAQSEDVVGGMSAWVGSLDSRLRLLIEDLDDGSAMGAWIADQAHGGSRSLWIEAAWQVALTMVLSGLAWVLMSMLVRRHMRRLQQREIVGWTERPIIALGRLSLRIIPIGVFVIVAYAVMLAVSHNDLARSISVAAVNAFALTRVGMALVRSILAPLTPQIRAVPLSDRQAAYLVVWMNRFLVVAVYGFFATDLLGLLGFPDSSVALLLRLVGFVLLVLTYILVVQSRQLVADWIISHPEGGSGRMLRHRLADIWHILAMLAATALFVVWSLDASNGFMFLLRGFGVTTIAIFGALLASTLAGRGLERLFRIGGDLNTRFPGLGNRSNRYVSLVSWSLSTMIWLFALSVVTENWGIGAFGFLMSQDGLGVIGSLAAVLTVVVLAVVAWSCAMELSPAISKPAKKRC